MRVEGKNPKNVWFSDKVKATIMRKEQLGARGEYAKERCMEAYKKEKRKVKICIYRSKREVGEQFRRKINQVVNGNLKLEVGTERG